MPDAVMEPDVLSVLRTYVREDGGKPKTAVEELSESFVGAPSPALCCLQRLRVVEITQAQQDPLSAGYAHMASLVCKWLQQSEDPSRTPGAEATPQDEAFFLKASHRLLLLSMYSDAQVPASKARTDHITLNLSWQMDMHCIFSIRAKCRCASLMVITLHLASTFDSVLQGVIQERFDPEKLDSVLRSKEHTPAWVGGLTSDRIGRQLIYDLSGVHRNSLMLNFAVQKILADGHDQEASGPSTPVQAALIAAA